MLSGGFSFKSPDIVDCHLRMPRLQKVSDTMSGNATRGGGDEEGELDWDNVQVGFVFSSFSWGYMTTQVKLFHECCEVVSSQILGGRLAELYGFKKVR